MKKISFVFLFTVFCAAGFAQRYTVVTSIPSIPFKRHFSYSIEGGYVDDLPRQFIAGDRTDWIIHSKLLVGNSISGSLFHNGRECGLDQVNFENIILTDFVIQPGNYEYAAGTGIYFPDGPTGMAYPFFGIYERRAMQIVSLIYYDLSYPADVSAKQAAGVRIKYSAKEEAYYISGVMVDRPFADMNFYDIQGRSNGFIMKIDQSNLAQAQVLAFTPSVMPVGNPELCSVNDMEISSDQTFIAFTGVNTESNFSGYVQPMVGKIDMDLNLQWCKAYEIKDLRYSGVDVEFGLKEESLFVLMNSEGAPFSIMELDMNGTIIQQPEKYNFSIAGQGSVEPLPAIARGHRMHYTDAEGLIVTGNSFILEGHTRRQDLFTYDIPAAANLSSGNANFNVYHRQVVPLGSQIEVTSWWAPENSIYFGGNLSLVGIYNDNNTNFGYSYVNVPGFDTDCLLYGIVEIKEASINHIIDKPVYLTLCDSQDVQYIDLPFDPDEIPTCIGPDEKSSSIIDEIKMTGSWKYAGIDEGGIYAIINSETQSRYQINVFDITGRMVHSES
ncbi:MAG TPA: hypothetical protein DCL86_07175, partial [Bacteroidales bacterium]|nr:hypothetical protein [Bacteroidales bacterium]